jgi:lysophospholipase L1-like esterase
MASGKRKGGRPLGRGILLPVIAFIMVAAASAACVKLVLYPSQGASGRAVSAPASTASLSGVSPSKPASSAASSGAAKTGLYTDFASTVFIGDSLTSGIQEYSVVKNAGVYTDNGMSTSSVLTKKVTVGSTSMTVPDALKQVKPTKIYILLGANDITWMSQTTFITNYGKVLDSFKAAAPDAVCYVQSIFPVTAAYETKQGITNDKINTFNAALAKLCTDKGVKYVDVSTVLKGADGKLIPAAASDGYNIKKAYYGTWLDYLTTHE